MKKVITYGDITGYDDAEVIDNDVILVIDTEEVNDDDEQDV